jgi:hypothetical protein
MISCSDVNISPTSSFIQSPLNTINNIGDIKKSPF